MNELTKRQQAIIDLLWDYSVLPTGTKTKLGLAKTVERIFEDTQTVLLSDGEGPGESLVELGYVTLLDNLPVPDLLPGWSATERGNNLLGNGPDLIGYYECGPGPGDERTWIEVSVVTGNYPMTHIRTFSQTPADLLAHCNNLATQQGWEWIKNNLE